MASSLEVPKALEAAAAAYSTKLAAEWESPECLRERVTDLQKQVPSSKP
jgi:hypothetical protein